ncbi:MAG TPA: Ig-like domain-containing protein [Allosphingosinicella sp.]|nr:Ig-like domain-containing protein [Allosphingosinicella sp.]
MARAKNVGRRPAKIDPLNEDPAVGHGLTHLMFDAAAAGIGAVPLTAGQLTYSQNFDSLASSGATGTSLPADWTFSETGGAAPTIYSVGTGSGTTGDTWSFGIAGTNPVTDRAFGSLASTTVTQILIGASFANMSGAAITAILISYVGEQWRRGGNTVPDRLDFQISFNATSLTTGSWTDVNGLDFVSINGSASALTLDGNASANRLAISFNITGVSVANGATFWIRWIDTNIGGNDDGLAIDNFSLTATINRPPTVANEIPDQHRDEDAAVSYTIPANSFSDPDGNPLTYAASLADNSPLPAWLIFTAATRTFSGTPPANFNGTMSLKVTASDGAFSVSDIFFLVIDPVNDAAIIGGTDTGAVTEDGSLTASGHLTITDVDAGEAMFQPVAAGTAGDNGYGTFAMLADGSWTYTLDNDDPDVQALHAVDTLADTLNVLAADGTSHVLNIAIHGANEASANPYARVDDEALVNSSVAGLQSQPSVTFLADGRYVVVFQVFDGDQLDVRGRIFNRDGLPVAPDFSINLTAGGEQHLPQVAALADGGFVVVWQDSAGGSYDIRGRVFEADGASGGEIPIAAALANETAPTVAGLPGGGFVAVWIDDSDPDGDVRAQVFLANGSPAGLSFAVNMPAAGGQVHAAVTVLAGGTIVAVWEDGAAGDVRMRLFSAAGIPLTAEIAANGNPTGSQGTPCVVALTGGGYAIAWIDGGGDGDGYGIYARLFEADGDPAGAEFRVNTLAAGDQLSPSIAALPDGGFMVSWADGAGPDADDIRAQRFDATGVPVDAELVVNGHAGGVQYQPAMAADPFGTLVVAWNDASSPGVGGDDDGAVLHALLTPGGVAPPPLSSPTVDLNGGDPGNDYAADFIEGGASAIGANIAVTAPSLAIVGATITITDAVAGDQLVLAGALPATIAVLSGAGSAQLVLGGIGTAADWAAALALVRYTHAGDNPDVFGTDLQRAISVVVSDGAATSAPAVATVTIAAANDAPTVDALDGDSVLWTEGDPYVLLDQNMPARVFDPDNQNFGGGFLSIGVQANPRAEDEFFVLDIFPGVGTIGNDVYVDGAHIGTITSSGPGEILTISFNAEATAERVATLLDYVAYRNVAGDNPIAGARSVTYLLNDGHGGASVGIVTVDIAAVNDAPTVTVTAGTAAYAESVNTAPGSIAVDNGLTLADVDDTVLVGATVSITNNFQLGQDILAFDNDDAATFGNIAAIYAGGSGVLTLSSAGGTATLAQWQAALRAVTYSNGSEAPSQATRTIAFAVNDGDAASAAATRLLSVTAQNDSPSGANATTTINEDATFTFSAAHFGFSDVDGDAFAGVRFGAAPAGGTLFFDADGAGAAAAVAITSFPTTTYSAADIAAGKLIFVPATNLNGPAAASVGFTVVDNGGTAGAGQDADTTPNTLSFDIASVNDQPSGADRTITINEDAAYTLTVADFGFSDVDGNAFEAVIFSNVAGGTLYIDGNPMTNVTLVYLHTIQSGGVVFVPAANATGAVGSLTFTVRDDGGFANGGQAADTTPNMLTFSMTALNDAPVNGVPGAQAVDEDASLLFSAANGNALSVADVDAAALTVTLSVAHGTLTLASTAGLTFADGAGDAAMTFTGTAAAINAALGAGLTYAPAADHHGGDTLAISTSDNGQSGTGGTLTDADTVAITIDPVNDAPVNNVPGTQGINEDAGLTLSTANGNALSVADVDATTLTVTLSVAHGTLTLASIAGLSFSGGSDGTADASMTFSGTAAAINAALDAGLTYNPNANFNGSDAISVVTSDGGQSGTGPVGTDSDWVAVTIAAINDAPAGADAAFTINEDGTFTFVQSHFGFTDPVEGDDFLGVVIATMPSAGTLLHDGAAVTAGQFVSLHDIALGKLSFVPAADANGGPYGSFTFQVRDDGGTLTGGQDTDQSANTLTFNVTAVNDAPTNGVPVGQAMNEDGSLTLSTASGNAISVADVDAATLTVTLSVVNGTLTLASTAGLSFGAGDGSGDSTMTLSGTAAAINAALGAGLTYNPTANFNGGDAISVTATDAGEAGTGPVGTDSDSVAVTIAAINDAPSGTSVAITLDEDTSRTLTQADFGFSDAVEGDGFGGVVIATLPANGILLLNGAALLVAETFVTAAQLAAGQLVFQPDADANGAAYATLTFQVRDDGGTANDGRDTDQSPSTLILNVMAINDAPTGADAHIVIDEDNGRVLTAADFGYDDTADGNAFAGVVLTSLPTAGLLIYDPDGAGGLPGVFASVGRFVTAAELAIGALTYFPASHASGAASFTFQVRDNGGTDDGGQDTDQAPNTITFDVNPVNDAPSGTDKSATGSEDDPYVFAAADFGFSDPVEGNSFFAVRITTLAAQGAILLNGVAVTAGDFVAVSAIDAGMLTFQPDPNAFGAPYASFTFQVQDSGGTAYGGVDTDQTPNTITISITPDNLAPVLDLDSGTAGANAALTYTENDSATRIAPAATLTDDSADFAGGTITARFAANGAAADQLSLQSGNGIAVSPTDDTLTYGGVPIGFWSGGAAGADLVVQLNANATAAAVEAVLRAIAYANLSDDPSVPARTIAVEVTDGDGGATSAQANVDLVAIDDAAVARNDSFALDEGGALAGSLFADHGAGADADVDGPELVVAAVNGASAHVGQQILLASGALLTLNADGSFAYAANHAFDATPTVASGASNTTAFDRFTYTLAGGGTATVTLAITGVDSDDILQGTGGNDVLVAGIGDDMLDGGAGNDVLYGEGGADIARGGTGDDVYIIDSMADITEEAAGEGNDTIITSLSYILSSLQEIETLTTQTHAGTDDLFLTGNQYNNILIGNAGDNLLNGVDGADVMYGLAGDDTYAIDNLGDLVIDGFGQGNDLVLTYLSHTLSNGNEIETLSTVFHLGTDAINLGGNDYNNTLIGNYGANYLNGNGGVDVMIGLNGNDTYVVENALDVVEEAAGGGSDLLYSFVSYTLAAGQEVETISTAVQGGTGAINLTGNEFGQTLIGNYGANLLNGGSGNDVLYGLNGADMFAFTTALGAGNVDTVADFVAGTDRIGLDDAIFTAIGGALNANAFVIGTAAGDADDRIVYDQATGRLFYDADGSGAGAAVQFATIGNGLALTAADFTMI